MTKPEETRESLGEKVASWLTSEGYPLEFTVAEIFKREGFNVRQGHYVRDVATKALREIDVIAADSLRLEKAFVRVSHIVECKWSKNKPWVVFTSDNNRMHPAACISQTLGSLAGEAFLWCQAGNETLQGLDVFSTPRMPGLNGRQAFTKDNDAIYSAMQSVCSASRSLVKSYDAGLQTPFEFPQSGIIALPVIVIDGQLFTASYDPKSDGMAVEEAARVRIHWRGADSSLPHTTVDVVTISALQEFVSRRYREVSIILQSMSRTYLEIEECFRRADLASLSRTLGSRGMRGLPPLLYTIEQLSQQRVIREKNTQS